MSNGAKAVADSEKVGGGWAVGPVGVENYRTWGGGLDRKLGGGGWRDGH